MDGGYEVYCLADPVFYESPLRARREALDFEIAARALPEGWRRVELDDWLVVLPDGVATPAQGWKIHASACTEQAEEVVAAVWDFCVSRRIPFKFIRSRELYFLRNTKYADRGSSGKLVTIYPADETQLAAVLPELAAILEGRAGPYILSDLRWGDGPLYVRYGGFADRYCIGPSGEVESAIADAGGRLVPDRRGPTFEVPPWVSLPRCLEPHLAARNAAKVDEIPYTIDSALHFSNGGGVYAGVDARSGDRVVLKEARPHAGLALDGADAVARLAREREMLERLAGLEVVPAVRDHFLLGEHHFLVEDFVEATPLRAEIVERYPLVLQHTGPAEAAAYAGWALELFGRVQRAVAAIHERGVVLGDLHPFNVLVRPDGRVAIIDLEAATDVNAGRRQTLADPGFVAPRGTTGFAIDEYALACLRLFMFMPLTTLIGLAPEKAERLADEIAAVFPVPRAFLDEAVATIAHAHAAAPPRSTGVGGRPPRMEADAGGWARARESMAAAIVASATPEREDRLFPGDVKQFPTGGLSVAYGAAGVLYALAQTGAGRHEELEQWLVRRADAPESGTPLGFYDGLHGVAHVLEELGRRDDALRVLECCEREIGGRWEELGSDLRGGLAGVGLNFLHFARRTADTAFRDAAVAVGEIVAGRVGDETDVAEISGGQHPYAGLLRGSAGVALFLIRLYEETRDEGLLDVAATALRQDLRRCTVREEDGSLEVDEGWRTMPYLADGSVGIGLVLADFLALRGDERFAAAAAAIRLAAEAQFYVEPGLFWGRAGMILYLSRGHAPGRAVAADPVVAAQVRRLDWHALTFGGHLAFPGEQLLRLSMDLGTGTAGVLLALGAALHDAPVHLPFLDALPAPRAAQRDRLEYSGRR